MITISPAAMTAEKRRARSLIANSLAGTDPLCRHLRLTEAELPRSPGLVVAVFHQHGRCFDWADPDMAAAAVRRPDLLKRQRPDSSADPRPCQSMARFGNPALALAL